MSSTLLHSWNAFSDDPNKKASTYTVFDDVNFGGIGQQSAHYLSSSYVYNKTDIISSIISRIALDASMVDFKHLKVNDESGNQNPVKSSLIECLTVEANIDQTGRAFIYDAVWSLLDEGVIALVATDTSVNIHDTTSYDVLSMRVAKITQWYPKHVQVRCYNENTGLEQDLTIDKRKVAIIESPLLTVLRDNNPTLGLLQQKITLMQSKDRDVANGKINGFLQFPYQTRATARKSQAEERRKQIELEMTKSVYGIATLDANEKFIPVGGGVANNMLDDILKLKQDYYNQLGITEAVFNGTAQPSEINQYYHRLVDPIIQAIVDAINRTYLTKTARTRGQRIMFFRDPFRTLPVEQIASVGDSFSRNAIFTPNEIRSLVGKPPHPDVLADQLFNRNIADGNQNGGISTPGQAPVPGMESGPEIYDDGNGGFVDINGYPVDEYGNPLE